MMKYLLLLSLTLMVGCTHSIHLVHSDGFGDQGIDIKKAKYIKASASQDVIFFFAYDTDYVDEARAQLEAQCPGKVSAVSTQFSTSHGFLSWTNKVLMQGICEGS